MPPSYKISYFNNRGAAEPLRLVLALQGLDFVDDRVERENWPTLKPNSPWGTMPILEEDGKRIGQSASALRYLGKKYGLVGSSAWEEVQCDEYVEAMKDLLQAAAKGFLEPDPAKKKEIEDKLRAETMPFYLTKFNTILEQNGSGYFVGKKLTIADLHIAAFLQVFNEMHGGVLAKFPALEKHQQTVFSTKGIKEWVERRPKTEF